MPRTFSSMNGPRICDEVTSLSVPREFLNRIQVSEEPECAEETQYTQDPEKPEHTRMRPHSPGATCLAVSGLSYEFIPPLGGDRMAAAPAG